MLKRRSALANGAKRYKKAQTKKTKRYARPTTVRIGKQTFPKQLFNTLKYCEEVVIAASSGKTVYLWSTNGLYDPNITGTGHQPRYFDQMCAVYNHYTVLRSRIKAVIGYSASVSTLVVGTVYIDDDTSVNADALIAAEMNGAKSDAFVPSAQGHTTIYHSWDAKQQFGGNPQGQDAMMGTSSSNPSEQSYFTVQTYDVAANATNAVITVYIEYDVVWDDLTTIGVS